jgi:hypothetical protein
MGFELRHTALLMNNAHSISNLQARIHAILNSNLKASILQQRLLIWLNRLSCFGGLIVDF